MSKRLECPNCDYELKKCPVCGGWMKYRRKRSLKDRETLYYSCGCGAEVRIKMPRSYNQQEVKA